jgi:gliding motility-associated lipoprotein GldB
MKKSLLLFASFTLLLISCKKNKEEQCAFIPDKKGIAVNVKIESLEDSLPSITSKQQLVDFFGRHPVIRDSFFGRNQYPSDSVFINEMYNRFTNPHIDTLLTETHRVFGDLSELKKNFTEAFSNLKYYYPQFKEPKIQTIISGFQTDLFVSDTLIIVSLDYYLGKGAKYKPQLYDYMLRRYHKDFIVPSVLLLYGIDPKTNKTNLADKTVLADMIAYGKAYYFAKRMLPCLPDSILMGYKADEMKGSRDNEDKIYIRLVENQVLYSTSHKIKEKYISERPKTLEVGEKCPGRIGTWIGWRIVDAYADKHTDKTLPEIMSLPDSEAIFKESKYRPKPN